MCVRVKKERKKKKKKKERDRCAGDGRMVLENKQINNESP